MTKAMHDVLRRAGDPEQLRALNSGELIELAAAIRAELIDTVPRTGGHLGPNLGVVELTIAVHRVFHSPRDSIVFDTGHQSYVHKMLTGRTDRLAGLRSAGGLSGYPSRAESPHDLVENSHASTALCYADGLAKAFARQPAANRYAVAVVGDGALTGGMCWEALNNIGGAPDRPIVIVLNDNGRSYGPTVGALANHLAGLRAGRPGPDLFGGLGLDYLGPVDGHDLGALEAALRLARRGGRATVVHCVTEKGRGYLPAETDEADRMHTISPATTEPASGPSWTSVFAAELVAIGDRRPDVVAVTAAMLRPTGLHPFAVRYPDRVYDVGIAEQHAVASAAGLASAGLHPVVAIYATFLNRGFDQVLMDVALHRLPVTFVLDRAGITGPDGASHHGMWDLSLLGMVPGMRVAAPRDGRRLRELLAEAVELTVPSALRFPKGSAGAELPAVGRVGSADVLVAEPAAEVLIIPVGPLAGAGCAAAELLAGAGVAASVIDPRWVQPVDPALVDRASKHALVLTVEDNVLAGGFGDAFCRAMREAGVSTPVRTLGLPRRFLEHGERPAILARHGLDATGLAAAVLAAVRPAQFDPS